MDEDGNNISGIIYLHLSLERINSIVVDGILIINLDYMEDKVA